MNVGGVELDAAGDDRDSSSFDKITEFSIASFESEILRLSSTKSRMFIVELITGKNAFSRISLTNDTSGKPLLNCNSIRFIAFRLKFNKNYCFVNQY